MLLNVSQAPALLTPVHRLVRDQEAQAAVTLNDSMNGPKPLRAHCLAVSCFDMDPNTSLALGQGFRSLFTRGRELRLSAHSLQRQEWFFSAWLRGNECGMWLTQGRMDVSHCDSSPLSSSDHLSVCHSVCLGPSQTV